MTAQVAARTDRAAARATRHRAILELVASRPIRTQEELVTELERRRLSVTQATVSRDIRELGLVRTHDDDGGRYLASTAPPSRGAGVSARRWEQALRDHVLGLEFIGHLGILHTAVSTAPYVGAALDAMRYEEVAGTVAGDDTVLVVTRGVAAARRLQVRLNRDVGERR